MIEMSHDEINRLLADTLIGRLAMSDRVGRPYVIPLPFCWADNALYLRLPLSGRKGEVLKENNRVCFEVDCFTADLSDYASVLIEGRLESVSELLEKTRIKTLNEQKYNRLRNGNRPGHGRSTPLEALPMQKIQVGRISGRKKSAEVFNGFVASQSKEKFDECPVTCSGSLSGDDAARTLVRVSAGASGF